MALYKSLLGIHNAYAIGSPATAMMFEFGPPKADKGSLRRLRIDLGVDGRMSGAEVRSASVTAVLAAMTGLTDPRTRSVARLVRRDSRPRPDILASTRRQVTRTGGADSLRMLSVARTPSSLSLRLSKSLFSSVVISLAPISSTPVV